MGADGLATFRATSVSRNPGIMERQYVGVFHVAARRLRVEAKPTAAASDVHM